MEDSASTPPATSASTSATPAAPEELDKEQVRGPWGDGLGNGWPWPCEARGARGRFRASADAFRALGGSLIRCAPTVSAP